MAAPIPGATATPSAGRVKKPYGRCSVTKPRVFVTRRRVPDAIALLEEHFDVEVWGETTPPPRPVVLARVGDVDGMLTEVDDIVDAEVLGAAARLRVVANRGVGYDNIDVTEATTRGVAVCNTPGILTEASADLAFGLMLAVARNIAYGDRQIRAGAWTVFDQVPYLGLDVHGKTLGILGLGKIGLAVARRARGFDMRVLYHSRTRKPEAERQHGLEWVPDMSALLGESDFVSVHVALTPETRKMIGAAALRQMKRDAILINTSRGPTVDLKALYQALREGTIAGAGLDVTDPEPIPHDDPIVSMPNVVITPHIGSASAATFRAMGLMAARNVIAVLAGQPIPACVNPEALKSAAN